MALWSCGLQGARPSTRRSGATRPGQQRKRRLGRAWLEPDPDGDWGGAGDGSATGSSTSGAPTWRWPADRGGRSRAATNRPEQREATLRDAASAGSSTSSTRNESSPRPWPATGRCWQPSARCRTPRRGRKPAAKRAHHAGVRRPQARPRSRPKTSVASSPCSIARRSARARSTSIARSCTRSSSTRGATTPSGCARTRSPGPTSAPKKAAAQSRPSSPRKSGRSRRQRERACTAARRLRELRLLGRDEAEWRRINEQDAALFIIAACTGLRLGELCALRWSDVDLEGRRHDRLPGDVGRERS